MTDEHCPVCTTESGPCRDWLNDVSSRLDVAESRAIELQNSLELSRVYHSQEVELASMALTRAEDSEERVAELERHIAATDVQRARILRERDTARSRVTELEAEIKQWKAGKYITSSAAVRMAADVEARWREKVHAAIDSLNLHRQVPRDEYELHGLCEDDKCLWWDMTYSLQDELLNYFGWA